MGQLRNRRGEDRIHLLAPVEESDLLSGDYRLADVDEDDSEAWDDEDVVNRERRSPEQRGWSTSRKPQASSDRE